MTAARYITTALALALVTTIASRSASAAPDPAVVYEDRCARCHGIDAAKLARETIRIERNRPMLKDDGSPLRELLDAHGRLRADEADALTEWLGGMLVPTGAATPAPTAPTR
ncbi:MAG: hypothetical protein R3D27_07205 [Hyphomicrobiaceae bacterium]